MTNRHLAITMGDPAGIGPEIIVKSCARLRDRLSSGDLKLLIIGSRRAFDQARSAEAADAGAVRFVVAGLEDVRNVQVGGDVRVVVSVDDGDGSRVIHFVRRVPFEEEALTNFAVVREARRWEERVFLDVGDAAREVGN